MTYCGASVRSIRVGPTTAEWGVPVVHAASFVSSPPLEEQHENRRRTDVDPPLVREPAELRRERLAA
jgi:hypothetical protein